VVEKKENKIKKTNKQTNKKQTNKQTNNNPFATPEMNPLPKY